MTIAAKDPKKVRAGKLGMLSRWGAPRLVRLDGLTDAQRWEVVQVVERMRTSRPLDPV